MSPRKTHVYFMPGLAASPLIFEHIRLPEDEFELHYLEWEVPEGDERLSDYAQRIARHVTHENPVLIGVSFGGILVQEMMAFVKAQRVIIISSVKSSTEFPRRMKFARATKAYKLIPVRLFLNVERLSELSLGAKIKQRLKLYEKFLSVRDPNYLNWALKQVIMWDRRRPDDRVVHIHGDDDRVFPIKYTSGCIVVKGGTHIMILNRFRWLNEHLPSIIRGEPLGD